jgi:hypothetical protein
MFMLKDFKLQILTGFYHHHCESEIILRASDVRDPNEKAPARTRQRDTRGACASPEFSAEDSGLYSEPTRRGQSSLFIKSFLCRSRDFELSIYQLSTP